MKTISPRLRAVLHSPWFWGITGGYLLRLVLMPITAQHDVLFMPWMTRYILEGHWNLYAYLYELGGFKVLTPIVWAPYPYGFYLHTAGWLWLLDRLHLISLAGWDTIWGIPHVARYVFLMKLAYLPWDLLIGFILYRVGGKRALALWAWSPLAFYTPFIMGQNDIYATALAVGGTYLAAQAAGKSSGARYQALAVLALGLGSCFKLYPLFLLPPLVLWMESRWERRALWLALGMLPIVAVSLPFWKTTAFIVGVVYNHEAGHIFDTVPWLSLPVSPFFMSYAGVTLLPLVSRKRHPHQAWALSAMTLFFLFLWVQSLFYWWLWLAPFAVILTLRRPSAWWGWLLLQCAWAALLVTQHPDFMAASGKHLSAQLNFSNLVTAAALHWPGLYRMLVEKGLPLLTTLQLGGLLLLSWEAGQLWRDDDAVAGEPLSAWFPPLWLMIPVAVWIGSLGLNLWLARQAVPVSWGAQSWEPFTLQSGQVLVQELPLGNHKTLRGVRIQASSNAPLEVEVCILPTPDAAPLTCVIRSTAQNLDGASLYVLFEPLSVSEAYVRLRVLGEGEVTTRLGRGASVTAWLDGAALDGAVELLALTPLQLQTVLQDVRTALRDALLIPLQTLVVLSVTLWLAVLFSREV